MASPDEHAHETPSGPRPNVAMLLAGLVLPPILISLLVGGIAMWQLITWDRVPGYTLGEIAATVVGFLIAVLVVRTIAAHRRTLRAIVGPIREVTESVKKVANEELVLLADTLASERPSKVVLAPLRLAPSGPAEIADLALSFKDLHSSIREVAWRQAESLQGGVPSLIVTLATRNAALIDRQLSLLDQIEMQEKDPKILGTYYDVDHIGTRVRRNVESLLVLAGEPPPRVWARSLEMADVVRAAVSEIDEFQRVDIGELDDAQLAGGAVADVAHLLAELLENATRFSPGTSPVRVGSTLDRDAYALTITDRGPGLTNDEIEQLNEVLRNPPPLGRVTQLTTGMLVVAKLAARHGITVELLPGIPGLMVHVGIPRRLLEVSTQPAVRTRPRSTPADEPGRVVDLTDSAMAEEGAGASASDSRGDAPNWRPSTSEVGEASEIRSALSAFDRGRQAATGVISAEAKAERTDEEVKQ